MKPSGPGRVPPWSALFWLYLSWKFNSGKISVIHYVKGRKEENYDQYKHDQYRKRIKFVLWFFTNYKFNFFGRHQTIQVFSTFPVSLSFKNNLSLHLNIKCSC